MLLTGICYFVLFVESDSLSVVKLCQGFLFSRSAICNVILDIKALLSVADVRSISFFPRNGNKVAQEIARWAVSCRAVFSGSLLSLLGFLSCWMLMCFLGVF